MSPILDAVGVLNERLASADAIAKALELAADGEPPPWVFVFRDQVEAISTAADALETIIRGAA